MKSIHVIDKWYQFSKISRVGIFHRTNEFGYVLYTLHMVEFSDISQLGL